MYVPPAPASAQSLHHTTANPPNPHTYLSAAESPSVIYIAGQLTQAARDDSDARIKVQKKGKKKKEAAKMNGRAVAPDNMISQGSVHTVVVLCQRGLIAIVVLNGRLGGTVGVMPIDK